MLQIVAPFILAASLSTAFAAEYTVFHRVYEPGHVETAFSPRGKLHVSDSGSASLEPAPSFAQDLTQVVEQLQGTYQVALELEDSKPGQWDVVSAVKTCHLREATTEHFIVHTTVSGRPYALDYFVGPIPRDGACLNQPAAVANLNTTVELRTARSPPSLTLRVPPPLSPEGEPIAPVPEKSFFQKYWLYGAAILIALMLSGGPEEETKK
ncbi:hypothetical protein MKEN_00084100 [Mycena kentingensis (nom. inval.)]|nr:hypothetical protein MKEN_00084100 [Mycena kentingensis (nom. inval.)]